MTTIRYGIYLRPDPETCWTQIQINNALRQQFGLVSAAAFPPHATLVGNLRTDAPREEVIERVRGAVTDRSSFVVRNKGIERVGDCYLYNIHEDAHGRTNAPLESLALAVKAAVLPISVPVEDHLVTPVAAGTFWGHLSLASHDLLVDNTLADEVGEFLHGLPVSPPASFTAQVVSLFETTSADWDGHWWETLSWRHRHSWTLPD